MNALAMTPQSRIDTLDVDIPLHGHTDSEQEVAEIVGKLLNEISRFDHQSSHADILQALAIITAVREAMADATEQPGVDFSLKLLRGLLSKTARCGSRLGLRGGDLCELAPPS